MLFTKKSHRGVGEIFVFYYVKFVKYFCGVT